MAYDYKQLGWAEEDVESISSQVSNGLLTVKITLKNGNVLTTTSQFATGAAHITVTASSGSITQDEYNALKADPSAYVIYKISDTESRYFTFSEITSAGTMYFSEGVYDVNSRYLQINADLTYGTAAVYFEKQGNKVTAVSSASTDTQYPTAKAVYTYGQTINTNAQGYANTAQSNAKTYTDTAISNAITTALNTEV